MTNSSWEDPLGDILNLLINGFGIFFAIWLVGCFFTAMDTDYWNPADSTGQCYIHTHQTRNAWLTPGKTGPEEHIMYCVKK